MCLSPASSHCFSTQPATSCLLATGTAAEDPLHSGAAGYSRLASAAHQAAEGPLIGCAQAKGKARTSGEFRSIMWYTASPEAFSWAKAALVAPAGHRELSCQCTREL